jgi:hypothetical protein
VKDAHLAVVSLFILEIADYQELIVEVVHAFDVSQDLLLSSLLLCVLGDVGSDERIFPNR